MNTPQKASDLKYGDEIKLVADPAPDAGMLERNARYTVATRVMQFYKGKVAGKKGDEPTSKSWDKGNLTLNEALFVVDYAMSRGLNPFGDIHIWYYKGLMVTEHYRILVGWSQLRKPYSVTFKPIESNAERMRNGMKAGDIGATAIVIKDSDRPAWTAAFSAVLAAMGQSGNLDLDSARSQVDSIFATQAVGIVTADEMQDRNGESKAIDVKGWSWMQRAETRALRNALGRSHGTPTPVEIKSYAAKLNPNATMERLASPAFDPNLGEQNLQLSAIAHQEKIQNDPDLAKKAKANINLMRGDEDEDGIGDDYESAPKAEKEAVEDGEFVYDILTPNQLLEWANDNSPTPFKNKSELARAIKTQLGNKWTFPKTPDQKAWQKAQHAIKEFLEMA